MSEELRIRQHPILDAGEERTVTFTFDGLALRGREGEPVTSALFAAGIRTFGRHPADGSPQGIFCANGQCSQCLVIAGGVPVKGCMTPVRAGLEVRSLSRLPALPPDDRPFRPGASVPERRSDVLVIGGGPAGITGAIELARAGFRVLLADDKHRLGGKLVLQTHSFFGSVEDCRAGTRGIDLATLLSDELAREKNVEVWLNATVAGCFADGRFGVVRPDGYFLVRPRAALVAAGAREKSIVFPGWDLPGVFGAGAFQTLVNRDLVRASRRLFILGGGNVGLIAAYHALQAGIRVAGLAEALPRVGGYKVHQDKILRLGVPVFTSHTVARAEGSGQVERVVIAKVDNAFRPVPGTERSFDVDTLLVAVGLTPVNELLFEAKAMGIPARAAGDAQEIAEASAAMFGGRIEGRRLARDLGANAEVPPDWEKKIVILKSRPGDMHEPCIRPGPKGVYPVIRCIQEIPCDPCCDACPKGSIRLGGPTILAVPSWYGECTGCARCVASCPGLAIVLVDERKGGAGKTARVTVPFELLPGSIAEGVQVPTVDGDGKPVGRGTVASIRTVKSKERCRLVALEVPWDDRLKVAGFRIQEEPEGALAPEGPAEDPIVCRCERVRKSKIVEEIKAGVRDMNQLKARLRCGMGACGGKTCTALILSAFRELGIKPEEVTEPTHRPFTAEVPMGLFAPEKGP